MKRFMPSKVLIEQSIASRPETMKILSRLAGIPRKFITHASDIHASTTDSTLILAEQKGASCVPCPGTPRHLCCQYRILDIGIGCPVHCTYCFLHQYRDDQGIIVYVAIRDSLRGITRTNLRIGTGEFTDSLFCDHITHFSKIIVSYFSKTDSVVELKTKTDNIDNLIGLNHRGHTVIGWSLNPASIINTEEKGSASLKNRLKSAQKCIAEGYPVAFHFDPIIYHAGWEKTYKNLVEKLCDCVDHRRCVWISMGTLRFNPAMKPIIKNKFPRSSIIYEEMVRGIDGKLRYLQPVRIDIYRTMFRWLRKHFRHTPIYLCMESPVVWERSLAFTPRDSSALEEYIMHFWKKL